MSVNYKIINENNCGGFLTVAELTIEVLTKTLVELPIDDFNSEMEVMFHLRQAKQMAAHCRSLMDGNVKVIRAVQRDHN